MELLHDHPFFAVRAFHLLDGFAVLNDRNWRLRGRRSVSPQIYPSADDRLRQSRLAAGSGDPGTFPTAKRQQRFVGDNALPGRFQPAHASVFQLGGEHLAQHIFPRVELEQIADHLILQIGKLAFLAQTDIIDIEESVATPASAAQSCKYCTVPRSSTVSGSRSSAAAGTVLFAQFVKALDDLFLQAVELIAAFRQVACVQLIFQPDPWKNAASYSEVGVSALFSSSFGSPVPSHARSRRE
jgi:hypothetical protein